MSFAQQTAPADDGADVSSSPTGQPALSRRHISTISLPLPHGLDSILFHEVSLNHVEVQNQGCGRDEEFERNVRSKVSVSSRILRVAANSYPGGVPGLQSKSSTSQSLLAGKTSSEHQRIRLRGTLSSSCDALRLVISWLRKSQAQCQHRGVVV